MFEIQNLIRKYHDAADKGDVDTMLSFMSPDVIMYRGKDEFAIKEKEVEEVLVARAEAVEPGQSTLLGRHEFMVEGKAAVCSYVANVGTRRGAVTMVFRHVEKRWIITHVHDSWPQKPE